MTLKYIIKASLADILAADEMERRVGNIRNDIDAVHAAWAIKRDEQIAEDNRTGHPTWNDLDADERGEE